MVSSQSLHIQGDDLMKKFKCGCHNSPSLMKRTRLGKRELKVLNKICAHCTQWVLFKDVMHRKPKKQCNKCSGLREELNIANQYLKRAKIEKVGTLEELKLTKVALNIQKAKSDKLEVVREHYAKQKDTIKELNEEIASLKNCAEDATQPQNFII